MKISKQEKIVDNYIFNGVKKYTITRNLLGKYVLYMRLDDDEYKKLKTDDTPLNFKTIIDRTEKDNNDTLWKSFFW